MQYLSPALRAWHASMEKHGLYPHLLFACVVLAVWVPGGFNVGPYKMEDLALMRDHGPGGSLFDPMVMRLFRDVPVWLGLNLTPGGLQGWQCMLLLMTLARGSLFYAIVRRMLSGQELVALLMGLMALFQPADAGYFYVNTSGEQFALMLSLAGCLCAVDYLHGSRRSMLMGMCMFELLAGFTYSGFLPLMVAIPAGAWVLKWLREGTRPKLSYLALVSAMPVILLSVGMACISGKLGRDSHVADFNPHAILLGYAFAAHHIALAWAGFAHGFRFTYLPSLTVMAAAGLGLGWLRHDGDATPTGSRWLHAAAIGGLLILAAVAYLPFSLSTIRFADKRQLLMAGVFAYSALLYLVLLLLGSQLRRRWLAAGLIGLMSVAVTLTGMEKRVHLLDRYHRVETLLGAIAEAVPNPASGSFILVQAENGRQLKQIPGLIGRQKALTVALQILYGDDTLQAGLNLFGKRQVHFDSKGMLGNLSGGRHHPLDRVFAEYDRLIVVYYPRRGPARVLSQQWLEQKAGVAKLEVPYAPGKLIHTGPGRSIACTFLEKDHRPAYCAGGHPYKGRQQATPAATATMPDSSPGA